MVWNEGISERLGLVVESYAAFISGITVSFVRDWR